LVQPSRQTRHSDLISPIPLWPLVLVYTSIPVFQEQYVIGIPWLLHTGDKMSPGDNFVDGDKMSPVWTSH